MDSSYFNTPSRRNHDLPKPETGLAEWTSKIKALQRQVDADEEDEQKKLEEEIAAARQARQRRSRGMGAGSRIDSLDISDKKEELKKLSNSNDTSANDTPKSVPERQDDHDTALRKLMGRNNVYNPDRVGLPAAGVKLDSIPLAAMIGGRATGPRLQKHAPQQDAHDPTQFLQPDLKAPHPVFGSGGVAMPGMVTRREVSKSPTPIVGSESSERYRPSSAAKPISPSPSRENICEVFKEDKRDIRRRSFTGTPKSPSPSIAQRYADKFESPTAVPPALDRNPSNSKSTSPLPTYLKKQESTEPSPKKSTDYYLSNFNTIGATPKSTSPLPTYLKKEDQASQSAADSPSPEPVSNHRTNINAFSPAPNPTSPLPTYTTYTKEEAVVRATDLSPSRTEKTQTAKPATNFNGTGIPLQSSSSAVKSTNGPHSNIDTPLRRLMEANKVYNPDKIAPDSPRKTVAERTQTVSLAAFMGGSGKGVRLKKHAPQVDAHDPTQFIQPDLSAPHPIFGKGGIAMPGMVKSPTFQQSSSSTEKTERPTTKSTWLPVTQSEKKAEERPGSPHKTGNRERALSAPRSDAQVTFNTSDSLGDWSSPRRAGSPVKPAFSATPVQDRTISVPSYSHSSASRASFTASSLSRTILPEPKASSLSPQIPGVAPSPAFQKPPPAKELTPSLSRLQGRGFVQNAVSKVGAQLEAPPSPIPISAPRPVSVGGKKGSVLDRWQPNVQPSSPTKSTPTTPSHVMRRSATQDPTMAPKSGQVSTSFSVSAGPHALKSVSSLPSLTSSASATRPESILEPPPNVVKDPYPRSRTPGLGSATTMVLIKPSKSSSDLAHLAHVDELGMKPHSERAIQMDTSRFSRPAHLPPPRKPLIHPTKNRARKPKKHHTVHETFGSHPAPPPELQASRRPLTPHEQRPQDVHRLDVDDLPSVGSPGPLSPTKGQHSEWKADSHQSKDRNSLTIQSVSSVGVFHPPSPSSRSPVVSRPPDPITPRDVTSSSPPLTPSPVKDRPTVLPSPGRHVRIPSTGSRPTVMELAQTLMENPPEGPHAPLSSPDVLPPSSEETSVPAEPLLRPRPNALSQIQAEKRKSSYEKYSAIIMPPLKEEATPTPSPAGTLARTAVREGEILPNEHSVTAAIQTIDIETSERPLPEIVKKYVTLDSTPSTPLPPIDVVQVLKSRPKPTSQPPDLQTISVDVLAIVANSATPLSRHLGVFYESEILAIIHRVKSKASGLASTSVWCWLGRQTRLAEREERKLYEVAKRYGTTAKIVHQLAEPPELIEILGGTLAIRQGTRAHWTPENTTMHLVRSLNGLILIDELDLNVKNLCSAFSFCITILDSVYVWHGRGSSAQERKAAFQYANALLDNKGFPIELVEGENDADEMFWMIMGETEFAAADYWRWRKMSFYIDPFVWRVDIKSMGQPVSPVQFISMEQDLQQKVYIVHCIWELFIVVGKNARSDRSTIRFALEVAMKMSTVEASCKPYNPTVHVLILPSRLPLDLQQGVRDLDEAWLNEGEIPDHMNLLPASEALTQLGTRLWPRATVQDHDMLPLGIGASDLT
ncbi:unnamed protein product [Cyclocybe aegerita]|uniref:Gelsolin n=1 Tax=Cyclocybe aegerita TaxID=1973307 RepID=A0A8S0W6F6_CYCAE|nr:unnamed protein product [Cyclocybe aegerita]